MQENRLVWRERFNIGVDFLDQEHKKLFTIMNRLLILSERPSAKSQWACQEGIKYFKSYAIKHHEKEEAYMDSIGYGGYEMHKRLHKNFQHKTLPALEKELEETDFSYEAIRHFLGVCVGWLTGHTLVEDQAIVGKRKDKWNNLRPEQEMEALEQTIIRLIRDMFKMDTTVINSHYGGEDFGGRFCYRIVYRFEKSGNRHELLLVFEEKLLIKMTSVMLGIHFEEMNDIVINASRYLAQQFLDGVKESFPTGDLCDVVTESLLNYDELQKLFENEYPKYSVLFNTGEGYFAFCFISDSQHGELGRPINAENAMEEIKEYLNKNIVKIRRKILVVDDSKLIRQVMKDLLQTDYEVTLADSGMSAIKQLMLEKPDLILMDYEMPVCDGRQTLEMIRSEKEFADIPVIFLTGRGDKESIMKIMPLNPAGYLLKTMHSEDIKKNIDYFFEKE